LTARRRVIEVLYPGTTLDQLNGWPGTEVWHGDTWQYLGSFNSDGVFVTYLNTLN
jgi:hypothetical protein